MRENPVKIAVLVSGGGTNLQALIDAQDSGIIKSGKIELVIANNANAFALERAAKVPPGSSPPFLGESSPIVP